MGETFALHCNYENEKGSFQKWNLIQKPTELKTRSASVGIGACMRGDCYELLLKMCTDVCFWDSVAFVVILGSLPLILRYLQMIFLQQEYVLLINRCYFYRNKLHRGCMANVPHNLHFIDCVIINKSISFLHWGSFLEWDLLYICGRSLYWESLQDRRLFVSHKWRCIFCHSFQR